MTDGIRGYRDLLVWRKAMDWAEGVYEATSHWPRDERLGYLPGSDAGALLSAAEEISRMLVALNISLKAKQVR